jgi:hypothetical protein
MKTTSFPRALLVAAMTAPHLGAAQTPEGFVPSVIEKLEVMFAAGAVDEPGTQFPQAR